LSAPIETGTCDTPQLKSHSQINTVLRGGFVPVYMGARLLAELPKRRLHLAEQFVLFSLLAPRPNLR